MSSLLRKNATLIYICCCALILLSMFVWLLTRPSWELSLRNSPEGVIVEVFKSNEALPTFTTVLPSEILETNVHRAKPELLSENAATTSFYDPTLRPGRWTVLVGKTELDIMGRVMIVDGTTRIGPRQ